MIFKKILAQLQEFKQHLILSPAEKKFIEYNRQFKNPKLISKKSLNILIQMPESYCELIMFSSLIRGLKKDFHLNLKWINVNNAFQRAGKLGFLKRNKFFERKWTKLYLAHGGEVVFSHLFYKKRLVLEWVEQANVLFKGLASKEALVNLEMNQLIVGDLIYDTYLRYKPAATVDLHDPFLNEIIVAAYHIIQTARECISKEKPDILITSYATYIHHGIMVRIALVNKIKVISFGSYDQVTKEIQPDYPSHVKNYFKYPEVFKSFDFKQQDKAKEIAKSYLDIRFNGENDLSTYYMSSSAFTRDSMKSDIFKNSGKKRIVIFLHCFFDSPHGYRKMLYPDFYEWIYQTLKAIDNSNYDIYVKAHPNGVSGNEAIVARIKKDFPNVNFLNKKTNNLKLIEEGFDLGVTVHGTLAHEYPYFGIPVLNAGDNPHIEYEFSTHAKTREEYEGYLKKIDSIRKPDKMDKEKILEFYYMHNLHHFPGRLSIEKMSFINLNTREVITELEFKKHVEKYLDEVFVNEIDRLIYQSFNESIR